MRYFIIAAIAFLFVGCSDYKAQIDSNGPVLWRLYSPSVGQGKVYEGVGSQTINLPDSDPIRFEVVRFGGWGDEATLRVRLVKDRPLMLATMNGEWKSVAPNGSVVVQK